MALPVPRLLFCDDCLTSQAPLASASVLALDTLASPEYIPGASWGARCRKYACLRSRLSRGPTEWLAVVAKKREAQNPVDAFVEGFGTQMGRRTL